MNREKTGKCFWQEEHIYIVVINDTDVRNDKDIHFIFTFVLQNTRFCNTNSDWLQLSLECPFLIASSFFFLTFISDDVC
jgi:hypothetical protein